LLTEAEVDAVCARLGPDPLRPDADPDRAWARISRSRVPLATLLMDQSVLAGVGNVCLAPRHPSPLPSSLGPDVVDVRPDVFDVGDDYRLFCVETARRVVAGPGRIGGVIERLGNGEQISASKVAGCRAALAWSTETVRLAREHNDAQVVGVGARMHKPAGGERSWRCFSRGRSLAVGGTPAGSG
jgi:Ribose/Galactose Isomerase